MRPKNDAFPVLVINLILLVVSIWASLSTPWIQEYILHNTFTLATAIVLLAGSIVVCSIPERGLLSKCVLGLAVGLFAGLIAAWFQQDGLISLFAGISIIIILFLVGYHYAPKMPRPDITLQGIPRIILAGVLSNLIFAGVAALTLSLTIAYHTPSTIGLDLGLFCLGFPLAGFIMGATAAFLAGRGPGGLVAAFVSGIGWFIYVLVGNVARGNGINLLFTQCFLFVVVVVMPVVGARTIGAKAH